MGRVGLRVCILWCSTGVGAVCCSRRCRCALVACKGLTWGRRAVGDLRCSRRLCWGRSVYSLLPHCKSAVCVGVRLLCATAHLRVVQIM